MSDKKNDLTTDVLLADVMLRVTAIEKLLIEKGVFTQEELAHTTEEIAQQVSKMVMEKAQSSKNIDEFISKLEDESKKTFNN